MRAGGRVADVGNQRRGGHRGPAPAMKEQPCDHRVEGVALGARVYIDLTRRTRGGYFEFVTVGCWVRGGHPTQPGLLVKTERPE